jgi:hypothetical protein
MREIKNWLSFMYTVEILEVKEDSPYPEFHNKESVQSDPKKIKIHSTVTEKFEESEKTNLDSVVGRSMNLEKLISVENFGFILRATPHGSHTVQISEDKQGLVVYREHECALYYTQEDYPNYTRCSLHFWDPRKSFSCQTISLSSWLQRLPARIYPIIG